MSATLVSSAPPGDLDAGHARAAAGERVDAASGLALAEAPGMVEAALWRRLRFEAAPECRHALFTRHRETARRLARWEYRRRPAYGLDRGDFEQLAYAGLLQAIDRFDPLRGVPFSGYARRRIVGAITDGLASSSELGAQYASRQRVQAERVRSLKASTAKAGGGEDSLSVVSDLAVGLAIGLILEGTGLVASDDDPCGRPDAYESLSWREMKRGLAEEVSRLPTSEAIVVREHYQEGVPFTEIADLLGVSKGRVSQIHKAAITRLQKRMRPFA